jgi:hypothetical protein
MIHDAVRLPISVFCEKLSWLLFLVPRTFLWTGVPPLVFIHAELPHSAFGVSLTTLKRDKSIHLIHAWLLTKYRILICAVTLQEVLKQRIQADIYPNFAVALPSILQKDGPMGLYKCVPSHSTFQDGHSSSSYTCSPHPKAPFVCVEIVVPAHSRQLWIVFFTETTEPCIPFCMNLTTSYPGRTQTRMLLGPFSADDTCSKEATNLRVFFVHTYLLSAILAACLHAERECSDVQRIAENKTTIPPLGREEQTALLFVNTRFALLCQILQHEA